MPLAECPVCHKKPAYAGNTAYCPNCGWNRESAISAMRMSMNSLAIGLAMFCAFAAFMYWGMGFKKTPMLMIFLIVPALAIPFNFLYVRRKLTKLKAMPPSSPHPAAHSTFNLVPENTPTATQMFPANWRDEALLRTPPPRQIRVSKSGRLVMGITLVGLSVFFIPFAISIYNHWTAYHSFANVQGLGWGIAMEVLVALAAYGIWRGQTRECDLLEHGEVVMGRVLRQWTDSKRNSSIDYEFTDFLGSSHKEGAFDRTNQLVSGMPLVVFYDRDNPKRQIAYCTTLHEVILPPAFASAPEELIAKQ
jgi:hypothetical protein